MLIWNTYTLVKPFLSAIHKLMISVSYLFPTSLRVLLAMAETGGVETLLSCRAAKTLFPQKPANVRAGSWFSLRCFIAVILVNLTLVICIFFGLHTKVQRLQKLHSANWNSWHCPKIYYRDTKYFCCFS